MSNTLLPCPFCGSPAERKGNRRYRKGYAATVGCTSQRCPAKIEQATLHGTVEDAYMHAENVWNRRAQPANEPLTNAGGSFNGTGNVYNGTGPCGNICVGTGGGDSDANV